MIVFPLSVIVSLVSSLSVFVSLVSWLSAIVSLPLIVALVMLLVTKYDCFAGVAVSVIVSRISLLY